MLEDIRTCRATTFLGASWIFVFVLMHLAQSIGLTQSAAQGAQLLGFGQISAETAHLFGALRWPDLVAGESWRLLTATFIHFNFLHLLMNLVGLMQLGWLMEPWYGARQFLAINLFIGALGNLLGALMRQGFHHLRAQIEAAGLGRMLPGFIRNGGAPGMAIAVTSGGGSTIILGLIGLAMVVGWRSRTRVGMFLRDQMLGFLGYTALLGIVLAKIVDNYSHIGGTLAGILLGFAHRKLVRTKEKGWWRRIVGVVSILSLLVCGLAQAYSSLVTLDREWKRADLVAERDTLALRGQASVQLVQILEKVDEAIGRLAVLKDPIGAPEVDWPEAIGRDAPLPPPPAETIAKAREQLRNNLFAYGVALVRTRPGLDADLSGEELDLLLNIIKNGHDLRLSAKDLMEFQILTRILVKRARSRQEELVGRIKELNVRIDVPAH